MADRSRFQCASSPLVLNALLRRTRRVAGACLATGIAIHVSLMGTGASQPEQKAAKPLTTQFVKRQPRLSKPLELKKRPQPKQRRVRRRMVSVSAKSARREGLQSVGLEGMMRSFAEPRLDLDRESQWDAQGTGPRAVAARIAGTREVEGVVDLSLEMLDIEAMDMGKYYAMVIQDGDDRRSIRGFVHLGVLWCAQQGPQTLFGEPVKLVRRVAEPMNEYSQIRTDVGGYFSMDRRELLKAPWVFFNVRVGSLYLTDSDALGLGAYLSGGGFVCSETGYAHRWDEVGGAHGGELSSTRDMFRYSLAQVGHEYGRDWVFEAFPSDHPLYHCYFDFDRAPAVWNDNPEARRAATDQPIRGVVVQGRVVGIIETGDYERFVNVTWGVDGTRHLQFFVNTIVFALTQEGSITNRVMDAVR